MFAGIGRVVGSQGSFHIKIENLVPTLLISPLPKGDLVDAILHHPYTESMIKSVLGVMHS